MDASYNCEVTEFQTGYRTDGVKSHPTDEVYSQNFQKQEYRLVDMVHQLQDLFALKKMEQEWVLVELQGWPLMTTSRVALMCKEIRHLFLLFHGHRFGYLAPQMPLLPAF